MSEDEKTQQIGAAVAEYQAAKVNLAQICKKLERVFAAYGDAIEPGEKNGGELFELKVINGRVKFGAGSKGVPADLLNETELAIVLAEREQCRNRVKKAARAMNDLGITTVE